MIPQLARDDARLRELGERVVPVLVEALGADDASTARLAAQCLGTLGEKAAAAAPHLLEIVRDRAYSPNLREAAIEALGKIGEAARPAVPYLRRLSRPLEFSWDEQRLGEAARRALQQIEGR